MVRLENDIPTHEMTHGITNRMTGGGTDRCLQTLEAGSMGEGAAYFSSPRLCTDHSCALFALGWSDAMAEFVLFMHWLHI